MQHLNENKIKHVFQFTVNKCERMFNKKQYSTDWRP